MSRVSLLPDPEPDLAVPPPLDAGAMYKRYVQLVARWVARLGGPGIDVEDAVQEVFLVAHRRPFDDRGDAQVTTWLFRITSRVVSHRRRKDRLRWWLRGSSADAAGHLPATTASPVEEYERREAYDAVYRAMDRMNEKYRTAIVLFEIEGLSCDEIARLTGTTVPNVWVRVHRARSQFLKELAAVEKEPK